MHLKNIYIYAYEFFFFHLLSVSYMHSLNINKFENNILLAVYHDKSAGLSAKLYNWLHGLILQ